MLSCFYDAIEGKNFLNLSASNYVLFFNVSVVKDTEIQVAVA